VNPVAVYYCTGFIYSSWISNFDGWNVVANCHIRSPGTSTYIISKQLN